MENILIIFIFIHISFADKRFVKVMSFEREKFTDTGTSFSTVNEQFKKELHIELHK